MRISTYPKLEKVVHGVRVDGREREKKKKFATKEHFFGGEEHVLAKNIMKRFFFLNLIIVRSNKLHPILGCWPKAQ